MCDSHAMFMFMFIYVIVCMDGTEFYLYSMVLTFVLVSNLIENVTGLTTRLLHI